MQEYTDAADGGGDPERVALGRYVEYETTNGVVICDRHDPRAWIRSGARTAVER